MRKTYVIGDIHGCHRTLVKLLEKIDPDPDNDFLIFLGDYIDRGPDSNPVVEEIIKLRRRFKRLVTLMGNHDQVFLRYLSGKDKDFFIAIGGEQTLKSYGVDPGFTGDPLSVIPGEHVFFFNDLLNYWEDDKYIYVHAGLKPEVHITQQSTEWLFWARERFIDLKYDFGKRVIYGHTPFETPKIDNNKIGIDTGAVYGNHLTCLILPEMKFVSVKKVDRLKVEGYEVTKAEG